MNGYEIEQLIDIEELQKITENLHAFTGVTFGLMDKDGKILVIAGWSDMCLKFHRDNPKTLEMCRISDSFIRDEAMEMSFVEYRCKNGLVDLEMPVIVDGQLLATVFVGQLLYEGEDDLNFFEQQANTYGFDKTNYIKALDKIPRFSRDKMRNIIEYYRELIVALTNNGYLSKENALAREHSEESLQRFEALFSAMDDLVFINDSEFKYVDFYSSNLKDLYLPKEEFIGKTISEVFPPEIALRLSDVMADMVDGNDTADFEYELNVHNQNHWFSAKITLIKGGMEGGLHYLTVVRDITDLKRNEALIKKIAFFDSLTGLYNRTMFYEKLESTISRCEREGSPFAVVFIDLDNFKKINDSRGHNVGDSVLKKVGTFLLKAIRKCDVLARMGGDEFTLIITDYNEISEIHNLLKRLMEIVSTPIEVDEYYLFITCSIGVALYPFDGGSSSELIKNADAAMYMAKESGRNRYQFFNEKINKSIQRRFMLEEELRKASVDQGLYLDYQPIIRMETETIQGFEALLRWKLRSGEQVSPEEFIPIAEESGQIIPLGYWVINEACKFSKKLQETHGVKHTIAVNISIVQLREVDFIKKIIGILTSTGVEPGCLCFEITESLLIENFEVVKAMLQELKSHGIRISLDDFGTGYSSLSYVKNLPLDIIKIDRKFISDICDIEQDRIILEVILDMAKKLNLDVVAEGVENIEQVEVLSSRMNGHLQGYYYYKPMPEEAIMKLDLVPE